MAGLPAVATSVGSVPDVVIDGETGWLAPPTSDALAQATLEMLADPGEARRRGQAAKARCERLYGVDRMVDDHDRLYRDLATRRASSRLATR